MTDFKPGLYRHYKGDFYTALFLAVDHETRQPMVIYISCKTGVVNCRPLETVYLQVSANDSVDAWEDMVKDANGLRRPRFEYIGQPQDGTPPGRYYDLSRSGVNEEKYTPPTALEDKLVAVEERMTEWARAGGVHEECADELADVLGIEYERNNK